MSNLYIQIILDSLEKEKTLIQHDLIIEWNSYFNEINVPIKVITNDNPNVLYKIKRQYKTNIEYESKDLNFFLEHKYLKEKVIYGKKYLIIYPEIHVIEENKITYTSKRINKNVMKTVFFVCLDMKFKKFKKNLEKLLT
ncbi:hypothetical protein [Floccifex sp.]|uniref:hypothetical protein n=1 Tax=Floccifex sp. TaxID=2815810 RepID=UPI003F0ACB6B